MNVLSTILPARVYDEALVAFRSKNALYVSVALAAVLVFKIARNASRRKISTTRLPGPPSPSFIYGVAKDTMESSDPGSIYEEWMKEYGVAFEVPAALGRRTIMLFDPKALQHYYARETWTYISLPSARAAMHRTTGKSVLWAIGEDHRSHAAIRKLTPIYYDSAYKTRAAWEAVIDASNGDSAIIEVQNWMNHISLDSIGLAGFSYDFGSLEGKTTPVMTVLDTLGSSPSRSMLNVGFFVLSQVITALVYYPTKRNLLMKEIQQELSKISSELIDKTRKEKEAGILDGKEEKSVIGLLIKAEDSDASLHMTHEEVVSQMKILLLAGYETTSTVLSWALLELARNPDIQTKLRTELQAFSGEPNYDQLNNNLPYLDAVVHETLRLRSPVNELVRVATEDDVIPLSEPVRTRSGELVDSISVAKGTRVGISVAGMNRSSAVWGPDAKVFRPERWLEEDGIPKRAQEIQAYRHLLTFSDGPRTCLGKGFALAELKTVLCVLVKAFVFEMRDGPNTKVELGRGLLPRPKIAGEVGTKLPLRVKRYEG
ncbi:cytochrome P450 [Scleroderma yunnanense]